MRKFFTLLLLSGLMLLGAQNVWASSAHFYLIGDMDGNWTAGDDFKLYFINNPTTKASEYYIDRTLAARTYYFELCTGTTNDSRYRASSGSAVQLGLDADGYNSNTYYSSGGSSYYVSIATAGKYRIIVDQSSSEWYPTVRVETIHTITASAGSNCTASGTFDVSKTAVQITPTVTPSTGYHFAYWEWDAAKDGGIIAPLSVSTKVWTKADATIKAYCLADETGTSMNYYLCGVMNDWSTTNNPFYETSIANVGNLIAYIPAGTYDFKAYKPVVSETPEKWYGNGETYESSSSIADLTNRQLYDDGANSTIVVSSAGYYLFAFNKTNCKFSVFFPGSTYTRTVTADTWGTICLPYDADADQTETSAAEVTFYRIIGERNSTHIVLEDVGTTLSAGVPYIYHAEKAGSIKATLGNTPAIAGTANGLVGTYVETTVATGYYIIYGNEVCEVSETATNVMCKANKAYIDRSVITPKTAAPGRRIVEMPFASETATNMGNIEASEKAVKFIENGKLFIQKNGVVYDMTGRIVK